MGQLMYCFPPVAGVLNSKNCWSRQDSSWHLSSDWFSPMRWKQEYYTQCWEVNFILHYFFPSKLLSLFFLKFIFMTCFLFVVMYVPLMYVYVFSNNHLELDNLEAFTQQRIFLCLRKNYCISSSRFVVQWDYPLPCKHICWCHPSSVPV